MSGASRCWHQSEPSDRGVFRCTEPKGHDGPHRSVGAAWWSDPPAFSGAPSLYERARRHGLSHEKAMDAVEAGELRCWCGNPTPCIGGAQRFVGCAYVDTPTYKGWTGVAA